MFATALAGIEITRLSGRIASVWVANGAILAILMLSARRDWRALFVAALSGNIVANLVSGDGATVAIVLALCNMVELGAVTLLFWKIVRRRIFDESGARDDRPASRQAERGGARQFPTTLKQSAALLMAVLNDVLDFSKMEHNRPKIHRCDFDFEALAQKHARPVLQRGVAKGPADHPCA